MNGPEKEVKIYSTSSGEVPFQQWFDTLNDMRARDRILARIARVRVGSFGDWKSVGAGVFELRIDHGPGYRVYFGRDGEVLVILLGGGTKKTQPKDISYAKECWNDYKKSKKSKDY